MNNESNQNNNIHLNLNYQFGSSGNQHTSEENYNNLQNFNQDLSQVNYLNMNPIQFQGDHQYIHQNPQVSGVNTASGYMNNYNDGSLQIIQLGQEALQISQSQQNDSNYNNGDHLYFSNISHSSSNNVFRSPQIVYDNRNIRNMNNTTSYNSFSNNHIVPPLQVIEPTSRLLSQANDTNRMMHSGIRNIVSPVEVRHSDLVLREVVPQKYDTQININEIAFNNFLGKLSLIFKSSNNQITDFELLKLATEHWNAMPKDQKERFYPRQITIKPPDNIQQRQQQSSQPSVYSQKTQILPENKSIAATNTNNTTKTQLIEKKK